MLPDADLRWVWYVSIVCMIVSIFMSFKELYLHKRFENQCVRARVMGGLLHPPLLAVT